MWEGNTHLSLSLSLSLSACVDWRFWLMQWLWFCSASPCIPVANDVLKICLHCPTGMSMAEENLKLFWGQMNTAHLVLIMELKKWKGYASLCYVNIGSFLTSVGGNEPPKYSPSVQILFVLFWSSIFFKETCICNTQNQIKTQWLSPISPLSKLTVICFDFSMWANKLERREY